MPTPETKPLDDWGPMCPVAEETFDANGDPYTKQRPGRSLRAHAAIELRVPESGNPELDAMIRKARRLEVAGRTMAGCLADTEVNPMSDKEFRELANTCRLIASDLIAASEQEPSE